MYHLATAYRRVFGDEGFWPDGTTLPLRPILTVAIVLLAGLLIYYGWRRYRQLRGDLAPLWTYHQLASRTGLSLDDQWFLWRLSRRAKLGSPITLLICAATLDHHTERAARHLGAVQGRRLRRRASAIRDRLFRGR
jgi:hypothetical protein